MKKHIQTYEPFEITEFSLDWFYTKKIELEKNYWHKFTLTLRYGGGIHGHTSWYLTVERFKDGEVCEYENYPIMHINEAVKCYKIFPITEIKTYDNTRGLHEFIKRISTIEKK